MIEKMAAALSAVEHPRLAPDDDFAKRALGARIVKREPAIIEDAGELFLLI